MTGSAAARIGGESSNRTSHSDFSFSIPSAIRGEVSKSAGLGGIVPLGPSNPKQLVSILEASR